MNKEIYKKHIFYFGTVIRLAHEQLIQFKRYPKMDYANLLQLSSFIKGHIFKLRVTKVLILIAQSKFL